MHKHYVRRLDRGVAAHAAHGYTDIRAHKHRRVVYAVAHKAQHVAIFFGGKHFFHFSDLILRQERRLVRRNAYLRRDPACYGVVVARQHYRFAAHVRQFAHGRRGFFLDLVGNKQRTLELSVPCDVHHGTHTRVLFEIYALVAHEFFVAAANHVSAFARDDAVPGDVCKGVSAGSLFAVTLAYRYRYRVRRVFFRQRGKSQHFFFLVRRQHFRYGEIAFCQRAGFVKHEYIRVVEFFQIVRAFHQYAVSRRRPYPREERQRNGYHQGARARHYQKTQRAVYPCGPVARDQPRHDGKQCRHNDDNRRVIFGKLGDEIFRFGFLRRGVFHQVENFRHGRVVKLFFHFHFDLRSHVDAAADDFAAFAYVSRQRLTGQRFCVERRLPFHHNAVHRHFFTRVDDYCLTHGDFVGINAFGSAAAQHVGVIGAYIHEFRNRLSGFTRGVCLEKLAHLIKQQHGARFVKALYRLPRHAPVYGKGKRPDGGNAHKEVFVKHLSVADVGNRAPQHVVTDDQINHQIKRERKQPASLAAEHFSQRDDFVQRKNNDESRQSDDYAYEIFTFLFAQ